MISGEGPVQRSCGHGKYNTFGDLNPIHHNMNVECEGEKIMTPRAVWNLGPEGLSSSCVMETGFSRRAGSGH